MGTTTRGNESERSDGRYRPRVPLGARVTRGELGRWEELSGESGKRERGKGGEKGVEEWEVMTISTHITHVGHIHNMYAQILYLLYIIQPIHSTVPKPNAKYYTLLLHLIHICS